MTENYPSTPDTEPASLISQTSEAAEVETPSMPDGLHEVRTSEEHANTAREMASVALTGEVEVAEEASKAEVPAEQAHEKTEIDAQIDALYAKAKVFLEDSSKEEAVQGHQLDSLKDALAAITAQLNEAGQVAFAGNYMRNHPQIIAQIDTMLRDAEAPLRYNQDVKDQETIVMLDELRRVGESVKAADPSNPRVAQLEDFVLNFTNVGAMHYEDKRLKSIVQNFNQSVHDGYATVSDVQQMIMQVNSLVRAATEVTYRKAQLKRQLLEQAK